ncbi:HEATR2 [Symbiodinium sp. CCMP2592]|nr:HEATR2 [Symbiodinium sp. CCMP2592]
MCVWCVWMSEHTVNRSSFFASAAATIGQVMLLDYGLGANWGNLTIRLHALNRYLSQMLPAQQCDWVVFVDCYDSVIIGKEADICVRLEQLGCLHHGACFTGGPAAWPLGSL